MSSGAEGRNKLIIAMDNEQTIKSVGGVAPLGYRWQNGALVVDEREAPTRKLIYELFIKHKRKKTVARLLNDLGYRTRNGSLFSDTTIDRLIRDTTAKGIKMVDGREIETPAIVSEELWESANNLLGSPKAKQPVHLFVGFAYCICGGKMLVSGSGEKYVCAYCRHKIGAEDLEEIFSSQLGSFSNSLENGSEINPADYWQDFTEKEKRLVIEQILSRIIISKTEINVEFAFQPNSPKTPLVWQQNRRGNETPKNKKTKDNQPALNEPLMNEIEAAKFLGISRMTLLRKRNANEIRFFRVGFRVLYSKEKHLLPFLEQCEK
jgi:excisionase family DNA binding protein